MGVYLHCHLDPCLWVWVPPGSGSGLASGHPCSCLLTHILALQKGDLHSVHSKLAMQILIGTVHICYDIGTTLLIWFIGVDQSDQADISKEIQTSLRGNNCLPLNLWSALGRLTDVIGNTSRCHYPIHSGTSLLCHCLYCLSQRSHCPLLIYFIKINSFLHTSHSSSPEVLETYLIIHSMSTFCMW